MGLKATILITSILGLLASSCNQESAPPAPTPIRPVRSIVLTTFGSTLQTTFSGVAVSGKESMLSFKVSGTVQDLLVEVGQKVSRGQDLVKLDDTDLKVSYRSAVADLKNSEAGVKNAATNLNTSRSTYLRVEKLYESGSVPLSEFEQAKGNLETAKASLQAAKAQMATARSQLQAAENQLKYTAITAPFEGVVNRILIEENEVTGSGEPVLSLTDTGRSKINVGLSDRYIARMRKEMKATVVFPILPDRTFAGKVNEISFAAGDDATYPVTILLNEPSEDIRPGMAADVTFLFGDDGQTAQQKLMVPVEAVGEDADGHFVFIVEEKENDQGVVHRRAVTLGPLTPNGFEVIDGVRAGERVATSGLQVLLENMPVKLWGAK